MIFSRLGIIFLGFFFVDPIFSANLIEQVINEDPSHEVILKWNEHIDFNALKEEKIVFIEGHTVHEASDEHLIFNFTIDPEVRQLHTIELEGDGKSIIKLRINERYFIGEEHPQYTITENQRSVFYTWFDSIRSEKIKKSKTKHARLSFTLKGQEKPRWVLTASVNNEGELNISIIQIIKCD